MHMALRHPEGKSNDQKLSENKRVGGNSGGADMGASASEPITLTAADFKGSTSPLSLAPQQICEESKALGIKEKQSLRAAAGSRGPVYISPDSLPR
jgi:hypothetical protein